MPVIKTHASISLLTDNAMNLEGRGIFFWAGFWLLAFGFSLAFGFCVWLLRLLACGLWLLAAFFYGGYLFLGFVFVLVFFKVWGRLGQLPLLFAAFWSLNL